MPSHPRPHRPRQTCLHPNNSREMCFSQTEELRLQHSGPLKMRQEGSQVGSGLRPKCPALVFRTILPQVLPCLGQQATRQHRPSVQLTTPGSNQCLVNKTHRAAEWQRKTKIFSPVPRRQGLRVPIIVLLCSRLVRPPQSHSWADSSSSNILSSKRVR